ncbi:unnamed protein product [Dicrocoelium dendriticum]|nr:unnamed protein product [Dicrocoelium dendriticum]
MNQRHKLWNRYRLSRLETDYSNYKLVRNVCTSKKRTKRQQYEGHLAEHSKSIPKLLFSYLKRSTRAGSGIPSLHSHDLNTVLHDDADKANLLARHYSSVYTTGVPSVDCYSSLLSALSDMDINVTVVYKLLCELDPNSSPGPDGLHPLFLKIVAEYIAVPICHVFRCSLEAGRLPLAWKAGIVKPIYKGGNRQDPTNYRPICLTSVVCKVMERILKRALNLHFQNLKIISAAQHGFCPSRSCVTNLLVAREKWAKSMDAGKRLDVVFVDFSKAFDKVPHEILLSKLRSIGVSGKILSWLTDFLHDRAFRVQRCSARLCSWP